MLAISLWDFQCFFVSEVWARVKGRILSIEKFLPSPRAVSPGENETSDGNKLMVYDGMKNAFPNRKQVSSESRFIVGSDLEVKSQV